jgi:hypothetical protein
MNKKLISGITIFLVIIVACFYLFPQIWIYVMVITRLPESKYPYINTLPIERTVEQVKRDSGVEEASFYGIKFKTPWGEPEITELQNLVALKFANGTRMIITDPSQQIDMRAAVLSSANGDSQKLERIRSVFGQEKFESNYILNKAILNIRATDVSLFSSSDYATSSLVLLNLKALMVMPSKTEYIYYFSLPSFRGFQKGKPEENLGVFINLFDDQDTQIELIINGSGYTQEDIDFVLSSIEK